MEYGLKGWVTHQWANSWQAHTCIRRRRPRALLPRLLAWRGHTCGMVGQAVKRLTPSRSSGSARTLLEP